MMFHLFLRLLVFILSDFRVTERKKTEKMEKHIHTVCGLITLSPPFSSVLGPGRSYCPINSMNPMNQSRKTRMQEL